MYGYKSQAFVGMELPQKQLHSFMSSIDVFTRQDMHKEHIIRRLEYNLFHALEMCFTLYVAKIAQFKI